MLYDLTFEKLSPGHYEITAIIDGKKKSCVTTNAGAIDAAFDDDYDINLASSGDDRFYESQKQAQEALIKEIKEKSN